MKKLVVVCIALAVLLCFAACKEAEDTTTAPQGTTTAPQGNTTEPDSSDPAHEHNYAETVTAPTCTEKGYTVYTCACGDSYQGNDTAALGHNLVAFICQVCGLNMTPSEGLEYRFNSDIMTYDVVGIGSCTDTEIVIPAEYEGLPVTGIGQFAFYNCTSLTSITIPKSVTGISSQVFNGCSGLVSIVVEAGNTVFHSAGNCLIKTNTGVLIAGCQTSIIPDDGSVTSIGYQAFNGCSALTSLTIPNSVTSIGEDAFWSCSSLTSITIPDSVTSIGSTAFSGCSSLTSITIPDGVTSIGNYAFSGCSSLESITIPDNVTSIGYQAFSGCSSLESITIPDNVTSIGTGAFLYCSSLASITIGNGVTSIDDEVFGCCEGLTSITFKGTVEQWKELSKGSYWDYSTGDYTVYCTDGEIKK